MWIEEKFFKYTIAIILVLVTGLLFYYSTPIFYFAAWLLATILLPILFAILLYYLLRPLVNLLATLIPRYVAILLLYLFIAVVIIAIGIFTVPELIGVLDSLSASNFDAIKARIDKIVSYVSDHLPFVNVVSIEKLFTENLPKINSFLYQIASDFIRSVASLSIALALTPFILYYFLRDDFLFANYLLGFIPENHKSEIQKIIRDVDTTLAGFISTQATIALIVGSFLFVGYSLIGLPYALLLALFAVVFYVIPFLGTFIAIIPALLVAASIHVAMVLHVVIVMIIAHFIEAYIITPRMMSQTLKIHPLTIILLLVIGGSLFGLLGLVLIIPVYSIIKVFVSNLYKIIQLHVEQTKAQTILQPGDGESLRPLEENHP
jgi:predicted PurR-regulated permease PerM